jgi:transposase
MRDIDLFQLALGLVPPWMVADAKFDAKNKRLDIEIDFKTGGRFACPECGKADCPVHDTVKKTWRHLNFFGHQAFLHARVARIDCPDHGVRLVTVPWARPGSGFTLLFERTQHWWPNPGRYRGPCTCPEEGLDRRAR